MTQNIAVCKDLPMTIEDLKETAAMAHLNTDESELAAMLPAFEQMLGFFAVTQRETSALNEAYGNSRMVNSDFFTSDRSDPANVFSNPSSGLNNDLLNNAGERDGRFFVIPNVL